MCDLLEKGEKVSAKTVCTVFERLLRFVSDGSHPYSPIKHPFLLYTFFDWEGDGETDHVGIVERCEPLIFNRLNVSGGIADYSRKLFPCHSSGFTGFLIACPIGVKSKSK